MDNEDDFFSLHLTSEETNNKRTAVRYIRHDIKVLLDVKGFFNFNKKIAGNLLDISSKCCALTCDKHLAVKKRIELSLIFDDGKKFKVAARIVHNINKVYGIKFDRTNDELGDYLLSTTNDLLFK